MLIEHCQIPELLRFITCCNYTKMEVREWFWNRLISSVKVPIDSREARAQRNSQLHSVNLDTSMRLEWSGSSSSSMTSQMTSATSLSSNQSSLSGSDNTQATGHDYLDFPPASPTTQRKFNDYQKMSKLVKESGKRHPSSNTRADKQNNLTAQRDNMYSCARGSTAPVLPARSPQGTRGNGPPPLPPRGNSQRLAKKSDKIQGEYYC